MIDVVRAITAPTSIQAPSGIYRADAKQAAVGAPVRFGLRDQLARIVCDLSAALEMKSGKAALAVDGRFFDG